MGTHLGTHLGFTCKTLALLLNFPTHTFKLLHKRGDLLKNALFLR